MVQLKRRTCIYYKLSMSCSMIKTCQSSFGPKLHLLLHQVLDNKTPEEILTDIKLDISHLHLFGFPLYFHVPKDKRNKLEAIGRNATFVGYGENSKAYKIYIPRQRKVEIHRDVTFDEDETLEKPRDLPPPPPKEENDDWIFQMVLQCSSLIWLMIRWSLWIRQIRLLGRDRFGSRILYEMIK